MNFWGPRYLMSFQVVLVQLPTPLKVRHMCFAQKAKTLGRDTDCRKPPINVPYKRTFGAPDQGQMLDV